MDKGRKTFESGAFARAHRSADLAACRWMLAVLEPSVIEPVYRRSCLHTDRRIHMMKMGGMS